MESDGTKQEREEGVAGRAVLVTGGTAGIGRATARLLASRGASVFIYGRDERKLEETLREIRGADGEAYGLTADQSRPEDIRRLFEEVDRTLPRLDILVNNAAVDYGPLPEHDLDRIRYAVDTNLVGYMMCAREAVRRMETAGGGHIVNVGSMSADLREEENSVYVATKAGIQAFSESLRKSVNPGGIKVSLIEPGKVATDMVELSAGEKERRIAALEMLRPEDIAECILYCLSQPRRAEVVSVQIRPHLQVI